MDKKKTHIEWRTLRKAASNQLDEQEQVLFDEWLNANKRNQIYFNKAKRYYQETDNNDFDYRDAFAQFEKEIGTQRFTWKPVLRIAASVAIILGVSWFTYFVVNIETYKTLSEAKPIKPDSGQVELLLSNGKTVVLDYKEEKTIAVAGGDVKSKLGALDYLEVKANSEETAVYNTIVVPRGSNFKLTLSDSTVVWLNAESSIQFPVKFSGYERKVAITGEAYFDVAHNKQKPFVVDVEGTQVKVLGTEFNINSYKKGDGVYTTLVEGKVAVNNQFGNSVVIAPNQQAISSRSTEVEVVEAKLDEVLGWKRGKFVFEDRALEDILDELSRWYNFKVFYEAEELKTFEFTGDLDQYKDVNQLLLLFEKTKAVKFMVKENVLLVKKPENR